MQPRRVSQAPWENRFAKPLGESLVNSIPATRRGPVKHARHLLLGLGGFEESVAWQGVLKWTFVYRAPGSSSPVAYVVPEPARPRACVPVPESALPALAKTRFGRQCRERLAHAPAVDGVRWVTLDLTSRDAAGTVAALVERAAFAHSDA